MGHLSPRTTTAVTAGWVGLYVTVAAAPLGLAALEFKPGQSLAVNFSIALGFVALSVLGLQLALTSRSTRFTRRYGADVILRFHRQLTLLAVAAAFGHPALLFLATREYRPLLDVVHDPLRAKLAWGSVAALLLLIVTSVWRRALRLSYPKWHALHSMLGLVVVGAALGHAFGVHEYMGWMPMQALWAVYGAAYIWLVAWLRVVRPWRLHQRPWRVVELWPEPGKALTVSLEPAYRHGGQRFRFQAGQFAWILTGKSPLRPTYHPFSMSSSAQRHRVEFTIKDTGDFTSSVKGLKIGDTVYVDGPHGTFTLERHPAPGYVFLATGVGVTPFLSMLATMADLHDDRPVWLFLGNRSEAEIIGIRQLHRLAGRVDLRDVHVISQPTAAWLGERGRIDIWQVARQLPPNYRDLDYFICAADDVVRSLVQMLRDGLKIPAAQIHAELFEMV